MIRFLIIIIISTSNLYSKNSYAIEIKNLFVDEKYVPDSMKNLTDISLDSCPYVALIIMVPSFCHCAPFATNVFVN